MSNLSSSQVKKIQSLYEGIYQKEEELSQEDVCDILAIEIYNALVEEGLLDGEIITENSVLEGKLMTGLKMIGNVLKQVTGIGTKPTTKVGKVVRTGQTLATGAAAIQPVRTANIVTGAVTGAVKGAYSGATQPTGGGPIQATQRALDAASGKAVPAADDKNKNGNGWSSVPSGNRR